MVEIQDTFRRSVATVTSGTVSHGKCGEPYVFNLKEIIRISTPLPAIASHDAFLVGALSIRLLICFDWKLWIVDDAAKPKLRH